MMLAALLAAFLITACNPAPQPTPLPLATLEGSDSVAGTQATFAQNDSPAQPASPEPDRIWGERQVGTATVTVTFYAQAGQSCVRLTSNIAGSVPAQRCEPSGSSVTAVRTTVTDASGQKFTVIAGRALNAKITVLSIELDRAESLPAPVSDQGFFADVPGNRTAISVVPIDQYGNLVGARYVFR